MIREHNTGNVFTNKTQLYKYEDVLRTLFYHNLLHLFTSTIFLILDKPCILLTHQLFQSWRKKWQKWYFFGESNIAGVYYMVVQLFDPVLHSARGDI